MAEFITRKFTDKTDGTPRTGLNVRLKSVTDPALDPIVLQEIVTTVEADQGQYYAAATPGGAPTLVPHGVYTIERDEGAGAGYEPFEGEISVNPLRSTGNKTGKFPLLDRVVADVVRVASFLGDNEVGTMSHIQEAVNYAATRGGYVVVGAYGAGVNGTIWTGSPVTVPDGVTLDLEGATLYANSAPDVSVLNLSGSATVKNGTLKTEYVSGSRVCTQLSVGSNVAFENVSFDRAGTLYPTCASSANEESVCSFVICQPVVLAPAFGDGGYTRIQRTYACLPVYEVNGTVPITPLDRANVQGIELAEIVKTIPTALGTAPSLTPPFANGASFTEAVKQLWFVKQPEWEAEIAALQDSSNLVNFHWEGSHSPSAPNGDPAKMAITSLSGTSITSSTVNVVERKVSVEGVVGSVYADVRIAASFKAVVFAGPGDMLDFTARVDLSDMESAFATQFPGYISILPAIATTPENISRQVFDEKIAVYGSSISQSLLSVNASIVVNGYVDFSGRVSYLAVGNSTVIVMLEAYARIPVRNSVDHAIANNSGYGTLVDFNPVAR